MRRVGVLVLLAVITGCGGSSGSGSAGTPQTSPAGTPTAATASVGQFAGVISESYAKVMKQDREFNGCYTPSQLCRIEGLGADFTAKAVVVEIGGALNPRSHTYLGEPPAEVSSLVRTTLADARTVVRTGDVFNRHPSGSNLLTESLAWGSFVDDIHKWKPYGA